MHNALAYHSGGDDSDNAIGTIFSDEINRVPNVFFRERFSCRYIRHTFRYEKLVVRNIDRYGHLSSAPAYDNLSQGLLVCPGLGLVRIPG